MAVPPSAPDRGPDTTRFHIRDIQRELQQDRRIQAKMVSSVRRFWQRIRGRQISPPPR
jgi:hypothetical protein